MVGPSLAQSFGSILLGLGIALTMIGWAANNAHANGFKQHLDRLEDAETDRAIAYEVERFHANPIHEVLPYLMKCAIIGPVVFILGLSLLLYDIGILG